MNLSEIFKNIIYAILFGFMGLITGIWTADLLYTVILKNIDRVTAIYVSLAIIVLIIISASVFGFSKGRKLLE